jgi:large subunit ribosomal protein L25
METFELSAELRADKGKGASRRLRRAKKVPAILYGVGVEPLALSVDHEELLQHLDHEAFYSHVLTVKIADNQVEKAVLRDLQRHPSKAQVMHLDLQRVSERDAIKMHVPLHFVGEDQAPGVKQGGIVSRQLIEAEVSCLPKDLPEYIEADLASLGIGDTIHLSDLKVPAGVELVALAHGPEHDLPVVTIHHAAVTAAATEEEGGEAEGEGA